MVITVLVVLAAFLVPALARTKARAQGVMCMNNMKQIMLSEHMYQADHQDRLVALWGVPQNSAGGPPLRPSGWLDWSTSPENTNKAPQLINASPSFVSFFGSGSMFRCPADRYVSPAQRAKGWTARARSISRNALLGPSNLSAASSNTIYLRATKPSDLINPGPARTWFWLDEHPDSIDDFAFEPPDSPTNFVSVPSPCHHGAGGAAFGDGHATIQRWTGPTMTGPLRNVRYTTRTNVRTIPGDPDLHWLSYGSPRSSQTPY